MNNLEEKIKAYPLLHHHKSHGYQKRLDWIRTTITILTPTLVLLIGLQEKPLPSEKSLHVLLLTSIVLMTLSILTGLWVLLGESKAHWSAVDDIKAWVDAGHKVDDLIGSVPSPWHQRTALILFPVFVWLSILSLGAFGLLKYL
jgi:hypothetical protein